MKLNQKGAIDMMLVAALIVVLLMGGFVLMRISDSSDGTTETSTSMNNNEDTSAADDVSDTDDDENASSEQEATSNSGTQDALDLPVVEFTPGGTFTDSEKSEIREKLINPYVDFNDSEDSVIVSIQINDLIRQDLDSTYEYSVEVITTSGYAGFLYTEKGQPIDWYMPDCFDECVFTDEFRTMYPELVSNYENSKKQ